ncbi:MAG: oxamate carbamoyltransferase subunit AllH family protein [Pseudomonadota bacterium]
MTALDTQVFPGPAPPVVTVAVASLGGAARRALAFGDGTVLAVFERSFYLETEGGLACLGPSAIGAGPLNAIAALPAGIDWQASGLKAGAPVRRDGDLLHVGSRLAFALAGARAWRPAPLAAWRARDLGPGLEDLARLARSRGAKGLGCLIPALTRRAEPEPAATPDPFVRAALAAAMPLCRWMREARKGRGDLPPDDAAALIGLGPGLTPAGDDFVGGALIALRALGVPALADRLAAWGLGLARQRTGKIAFAHLACAARGQGAGALHDALGALARPGAPGLAAALAAIDGIGHSSGWDGLAGVAAACQAVVSTGSGPSMGLLR